MIILKIPRKTEGRDLREFILNQVKKFKRNQERKHIQLRGEIAYSQNHVYFILPDRGLELAYALSTLIKCQNHGIPCTLETSNPIKAEELPAEIVEAAKAWAERKLPRKFYRLRNMEL